jgi:beta-glucosidase
MGCGYPERLLEALKNGALSRGEMELAAKHILGMILKLD